jgi:hypothetical protein
MPSSTIRRVARDDQIPTVKEPDVTAIDLQAESRP